MATFHVTLHDTCNVACGSVAWVPALHVMGECVYEAVTDVQVLCHVTGHIPSRLVQDLIYYFLKPNLYL